MLKQHKNLFAEEQKENNNRSGYDNESVYSNRTTESVASIFASNAEFYDSMNKKSNPSRFETMSCTPTEDLMGSASGILLLDLRDVEDFRMSHIKGSISFPSPNIARDKFIKQIWAYRNKEDKIIVIYHEDEKKVIEAAQLLVEKEFLNIYIMANGFDIFAEDFPELIEGKTAYTNNNVQTSTFNYKKPVKPLTDCPFF